MKRIIPSLVLIGSGSISTTTDYSYRDPLNGLSQGMLYYRLRMVDLDGKFSYSPVREISVDGTDQALVAISPNPATSLIILRLGAVTEGIYDYSIFSEEGRQIKNQRIAATQNSAFYISRTPDMAPGSYFIKISGQGMNRTFTIIFN
jgi:hypothetical protein